MSSSNNAGQKDHYVLPGQLRIGLYVCLELPWFLHPFTLSNFKITSEEQLRDLRALKVTRFRFDPARSENIHETAPYEPAATPAAAAVDDTPEDENPLDPAMIAKNARIQQLVEHRRTVAQAEKAFVKAIAVLRNLNKGLLSQPKETMEKVGDLVEQMAQVFLDRPEVTLHVMGEKCGGEEAYHHGLNVSILCLMLAKALAFSRDQLRALGTGALLHDIGLSEIPDRVLRKPRDEYTKPERELRAMHVQYGVQIGERLGLAPEVLDIIAQHHELANGSGYPRGLKLGQITAPARVVSLINYYDNLCNPGVLSQALTPHEALSLMFAQQKSKFDAQMLQLMIRSLGVYPPGSIVQLSNAAIAVVVSVNPQKALRPWVVLYDAAVPREEAIMLNLETEADVRISKTIRPALLPAPVYAYLSPRKRITYYFDGESASSGVGA